ncbi:phosphatase PAP2 family protein [Apibacter sp. HY039]|uniref:phosphatase PAP2 family protein n=1 Tax=Apibacter sp. HY039 TaxID=2501476 RepID=UPI000FEBAC02|nr:phosphatase PAP2 family protein [Apibacter sp. HY039]
MNKIAINNFAKLSSSLLYLPLFLLLLIAGFLYKEYALDGSSYTLSQKDWFLYINSILSKYPVFIYNLTQFGDALVFLSFLSVFIIYVPKLWEVMITASLVSAVLCSLLKWFFKMPRPAAVYEHQHFTVVGNLLCGNNSLPSGHSITVFTILTVSLFAFMPKKMMCTIVWCSFIILLGLIFAFTRVGVGAHYPLDVIIGSIIGYISGVLGILIDQKYKLWQWIGNKKFYPFFIVLFLVCIGVLIAKIIQSDLIIFYFSIFSLIISLYLIIHSYVKK